MPATARGSTPGSEVVATPAEIAAHYAWSAEHEFAGASELYRGWAAALAEDAAMLERLAELPGRRSQPQLVFASARRHGIPLEPYPVAGAWLRGNWEAVRGTVLTRSTQTNEAARCGTLLPVLGTLEGPLALLEVGASAGLCLIPDRYSYRFETDDGTVSTLGSDPRVVISTRVSGADAPTRMPEVVWRAGIDLNPIDAHDPEDAEWLELLIWPGQHERRDRLRSALALVREQPVRLVRGDLVEELPRLAAEAPPEATLVVLHTAVLNYLAPERRRDALAAIRDVGARWISQEGIHVLDEVRARLPAQVGEPPRYVLAVDGEPVALTGFHGGVYEAIETPGPAGASRQPV